MALDSSLRLSLLGLGPAMLLKIMDFLAFRGV